MSAPNTGALPQTARLINAIRDALEEMERCPGDSVQDIWNEQLESWETGFRMGSDYYLEPEIK
jgi:hypothetical protein